MTNYCSKFLPQLSTTLKPLYDLLHKNTKFEWGPSQAKAYELAKAALQTVSLLVHYDSTKPLVLACDASPYGIGAVLSHVLAEGEEEKSIAYCSRTLSATEQKYSQLEKGLAIIFSVTKFHNYIYGSHFTIESDHQPLSFLFNQNKGIPQMASFVYNVGL